LTLSTKVYTKLLQVPEGKVTTYSDLAKAVGLKNGQGTLTYGKGKLEGN